MSDSPPFAAARSARQRALITGIAGFTGGHLAQYLLRQGLEVVGLDRAGKGSLFRDEAEVCVHTVDLLDRNTAAETIREIAPDLVFHLAALTHGEDVGEMFAANVLATDNLLRALCTLPNADRVKVLVPGSAAEYGIPAAGDLPLSEDSPRSPVSLYGVSKAAQTMLAHTYFVAHGLQVFIARPFNLVGPGGPPTILCAALASQIAACEAGLRAPVLSVGNLAPTRDFVDVRDVAAAYWAIVTRGSPGEVYNVASGSAVTVRELLDLLIELANVSLKIHVDPARVAPVDVPISVGSTLRLASQTAWRPLIPLRQSVFDVLEEWRRTIRQPLRQEALESTRS